MIDLRLMDVLMFSHRPKLPEIDVHTWMMQARPTSRHVLMIVSYVFWFVMAVIPVSHPSPPPDVFSNAVQAFLMSAHMAFAVVLAAIPKIDRARESKFDIESAVSSRHWVVKVVHA